MDDSNFDMENYSPLVDVKLLLKRILDDGMYYSSPLMAVLTPKSVIQLTAFIAFETGRKLNPVCCILLFVPLQIYIWQKKIGYC